MPKLVAFSPQGIVPTVAERLKHPENALIDGARSKDWWAKQAAEVKDKFARTVRQGVVNGEHPTTIAARITGGTVNGEKIKGFMTTSRAQATTLARQSVAQVANDARLESFKANSDVLRGYQQISTFDDRTTEICMAYSGATWDLDGNPIDGTSLPFDGGPPRHWNCRSVLVPVVKSWQELGLKGPSLSPGTRASMNGQVRGDLSFDQWLKTQSNAVQERLLGQAKAEAFRAGQLKLKDLLSATTGQPVADVPLYPQPAFFTTEGVPSELPDLIKSMEEIDGFYAPESWNRVRRALDGLAKENQQISTVLVNRSLAGFTDTSSRTVKATMAAMRKNKRTALAADRMEAYAKIPSVIARGDTIESTLFYSSSNLGTGGFTHPYWYHTVVYVPPEVMKAAAFKEGLEALKGETVKAIAREWSRSLSHSVRDLLRGMTYKEHFIGEAGWTKAIENFALKSLENGLALDALPISSEVVEKFLFTMYAHIHELGHQIHSRAMLNRPRPPRMPILSYYGNVNHAEWHAEHFVAYVFAREDLLRSQNGTKIVAYFDESLDALLMALDLRKQMGLTGK